MSKKVWLLILLLQFCCSSVFAEGIVVTISEQAKVDGTIITLGQLAEISGGDAEQMQNLRQLKLGASPLPGSSFVLTKDIINMRLGAAGANFSGITWQIPNSVTVIGNSQIVSGQTLIDKAVAAIKSQVGSDAGIDNLTISSIGQVKDIVAPLGNLVFSTSLPYGVRYNTITTVNVDVNVNERGFAKVGLKFDVNLYSQVVVAAREINARELFTDDGLRYERMDIGHLPAGFVTDKNKILGLMARRQITPGMVMTNSIIIKPVLIKRGSVVNLIALTGNMEVTAPGIAMQDGYEGQLIRIKNSNSNKIVLGKVIDENKVQVLTYKSAAIS